MKRHFYQLRHGLQLVHIKTDKQARKRTADNDQKRGRVIKCRKRRTFQDHTDEDGNKSHNHADDS